MSKTKEQLAHHLLAEINLVLAGYDECDDYNREGYAMEALEEIRALLKGGAK